MTERQSFVVVVVVVIVAIIIVFTVDEKLANAVPSFQLSVL